MDENAKALLQTAFDNNISEGNDGLNAEEAEKALSYAGYNPDSEVKDHFGEQEDGYLITFDDFLKIAEDMGDPYEVLKEAFKVFAKEDGLMDKEELITLLKKCEQEGDEDEVTAKAEDLINTYDVNEDGMLDTDELIKALLDNALKLPAKTEEGEDAGGD